MDRTVQITLDKVRHLKYTWGALRYLKKTHGLTMSTLDLISSDWTLLGPWVLAGLRHEDPELTMEQMDEILAVDPETLNEIVPLIVEALQLADDSEVDPTTEKEKSSPGDDSTDSD